MKHTITKMLILISLSAGSLCFGMDIEEKKEESIEVINRENKCSSGEACGNYKEYEKHSWPLWMQDFKKDPNSGFKFQSEYTIRHGGLLNLMLKLAKDEELTAGIKIKAIPSLNQKASKITIVSKNSNSAYQERLETALTELTLHAKVAPKKKLNPHVMHKNVFGFTFIIEKTIKNNDETDTDTDNKELEGTTEIDCRDLEHAVISGLPWYKKWPLLTAGLGVATGIFGYWATQKASARFAKKAVI